MWPAHSITHQPVLTPVYNIFIVAKLLYRARASKALHNNSPKQINDKCLKNQWKNRALSAFQA